MILGYACWFAVLVICFGVGLRLCGLSCGACFAFVWGGCGDDCKCLRDGLVM